jgi:phosphonate transport system substrate-binding protein
VIEGTQPLADYLASRLASFGVQEGLVRIAGSTDEMVQLLQRGEVDLYFDSVYPATQISDASGAQPILRRWRFGVDSYHSVIFTRKDSGIHSIDDLAGRTLALDNPYSTSGYFLPVFFLLNSGLNLSAVAEDTAMVPREAAGFLFSYDDENTLQWVLSGRVDAGATDNYHFDTAFPENIREQLVVLGRTDAVPRQVVLARADLPSDLLEAITQLLINADQDPEGRVALEAFQTTQFDLFPEGIQDATLRMREMMDTVQSVPLP